MKLLITGVSGFLGSELARQAQATGWLVGGQWYRRPPQAGLVFAVQSDIRDEATLAAGLAAFAPEVVIHTAYQLGGPELMSVSAEGAGMVARLVQASGARLVHLSSDAIFSGELGRPYTEQDDPDPIYPYGEAKARAEALVAAAAPTALIVRTSLIYGLAGSDPHSQFMLDIADRRREGRLFVDEVRSPVLVNDLAAALLEAAGLRLSGRLHVAGEAWLSRYEFGRLVAAYHGRDPEAILGGLSRDSGMIRPRDCRLALEKAKGLLRTRLRGVPEVLAR